MIFKGITKLENKFMYLCVSIRTFSTAIAQSNKFLLTEMPINKIYTKSSFVNFSNLQFLSIHPDITKLYTNLGVDLNRKFYGKTKYKTFLQFTIIDLSTSSNWYDFSYLSWEIFLQFCNIFQKKENFKNFANYKCSLRNITFNNNLDPLLGCFLLFYVNKYCSIEKGSFVFNSEIEKKRNV